MSLILKRDDGGDLNYLPLMHCCRNKPVTVQSSGAGYYIGVFEDGPYCRVSEKYWPTQDEAIAAMQEGFAVRRCMENEHCANGACFR
jgi:hypothetical protein